MVDQDIKTRNVSAEETAIAFSGPALFANKMFVHVAGLNGRLTFAELPPGDGAKPVFRTAVTLAIPDLLVLADLIKKVLAQHAERTGIQVEIVAGSPQPPASSSSTKPNA